MIAPWGASNKLRHDFGLLPPLPHPLVTQRHVRLDLPPPFSLRHGDDFLLLAIFLNEMRLLIFVIEKFIKYFISI